MLVNPFFSSGWWLILVLWFSECESSYIIQSIVHGDSSISGLLVLSEPGPYGHDIGSLTYNVQYLTAGTVRIQVLPDEKHRMEDAFFRLPDSLLHIEGMGQPTQTSYQVLVANVGELFEIQVQRFLPESNASQVLFHLLDLNFEKQYLEISNMLDRAPYVFGFGERDYQLRMKFDKIYTLFAADQAAVNSVEWQYGAHPFYLEVDPNTGTAVGVLLWNPHAMDVVLSSTGLMTYKVVGGVFDFFVFVGDSPGHVIREYLELIGKPYLPPLWSLGYQQSRWGYKDANETLNVANNFINSGLLIDGIWNDMDYMHHYNDFSLDPYRFSSVDVGNLEYVLAENSIQHVYVINPGVPLRDYLPYTTGLSKDIFIKRWNQTSPVVGKAWPLQPIVFPDFSHPNVSDWWGNCFFNLLDQGAAPSGIWLNFNEPSNFVDGYYPFHLRQTIGPSYSANSTSLPLADQALMKLWGEFVDMELVRLDNASIILNPFDIVSPPYIPGAGQVSDSYGPLSTLNFHTLSMSARQFGGRHYNLHSLYGLQQANVTRTVLESNLFSRAFVLTKSTFVGSGQFASHWTGENNSTFESQSIPKNANKKIFKDYGANL